MKITGKLSKILDLQKGVSKKGNQWKKQSFILDTEAEFNNEICFDVFGEKIEQIQNIKIGSQIEVKYNLSSKEFNGRYYHNIAAWDIVIQNDNNYELEKEDNDSMPF
tara:strand:+ start:1193 stop:1513 length:321 start_codon:yes stop_codon:yes gene_type:complete